MPERWMHPLSRAFNADDLDMSPEAMWYRATAGRQIAVYSKDINILRIWLDRIACDLAYAIDGPEPTDAR